MKACIWYISKYVTPPRQGTAGVRGYSLMREIAKQGFRCVIIASDSNMVGDIRANQENYETEEVDGMTVRWVRTFKYSIAKSFRRMVSWLDFELRLFLMPKTSLPRPDVLVVSSLSLLTILNGFWLRRKYKCRLVFEIRDIWPLTIVEEGDVSKWNPLVVVLAYIEKLGYRYSDAIVGTMPNLQEHVQNVLGVQKEVFCIPMGIDEDALNEGASISPEYIEENIPGEKFVVAYAGAIGITNALETYLECARSLADNEGIQFLIIGDGDLRERYVKEFRDCENLTFAPKVPKNMVQSVLAQCDVLYFAVHPSEVWRYGQSLNKVMDYMLAGKPIVASYTGFPSMLNEARCGSYVPANDVEALRTEILRLAAMPERERLIIGERGGAWVRKNRNYEKLASEYLAIMFPSK